MMKLNKESCEDNKNDTNIRPIDIGITRGGAKESYLYMHNYIVQRQTDMISNVNVPLDAKRIRALTLLHISTLANEHKQNELRLIMDSKINEEMVKVQLEYGLESIDDVPINKQQDIQIEVSMVIEGIITKYMDNFIGLEERYEVLLA